MEGREDEVKNEVREYMRDTMEKAESEEKGRHWKKAEGRE